MSEQKTLGVADFHFIPAAMRLGSFDDFDSENTKEFTQAQLVPVGRCRYPKQEFLEFQAIRKQLGDFHLYAVIDGEVFDVGLLDFEPQIIDRRTIGFTVDERMDEKSEKFIASLGIASSALMHEAMRRAELHPRPAAPAFKFLYALK